LKIFSCIHTENKLAIDFNPIHFMIDCVSEKNPVKISFEGDFMDNRFLHEKIQL